MKEQFVNYESALKLTELGFECDYHFMEYDTEEYLQQKGLLTSHNLPFIIAPLWQQAFDWFEENYNLYQNMGEMHGNCKTKLFC